MALLRHTTGEIKERKALTVNPAKTCQPIGAMYAALGVRGCFPHSHGSQGCCAYHRSTLTRHFKEPVIAGTSSFTEGSSVFGGQSNLISAIDNIFTIYDPETIAIHTTCLSETIGDDLLQISQKAKDDGKVPAGKHIIYASTPSYVGTHVTGYANMVKGILKGFVKKTGTPNGKVNVIPGFCEPSDMAEMRRLAAMMGIEIVMVPDTNGVLNGPLTGHYEMYPKGGATPEEIASMGDAKGTIGLGRWAVTDAVNYLDAEFKVPGTILGLPIGLLATDRYVDALRKVAGVAVPESVNFERGQVVDVISDYSQYFYGKKVALAGDPDQVLALVEFCVTLGMIPAYVVSGTSGKFFEERMAELLKDRLTGRLVPAAPVYKKRPGRPAHRQHLHEVHRPRRGHPADPPRLPHPRPCRPPVLPVRRLLRRHAPDGQVPRRHHGPPGPRRPRDPLRTPDVAT
jgi:nitrogenase molybdenum-iron protein beta chain